MTTLNTIQVAVIDDHEALLEQMCRTLKAEGINCVLAAPSVPSFFEKYVALQPKLDVILLDLDLGGVVDISHIQQLKQMTSAPKIVIVTGYNDASLLAEAIRMGADGYFVKRPSPLPTLPEVIRLTHEGGAYLEPGIASQVLQQLRSQTSIVSIDLASVAKQLGLTFSKREIEVLHGLLEELTYQEIGDCNHISINTVRHYVKSLYQKLEVNSREELTQKLQGF